MRAVLVMLFAFFVTTTADAGPRRTVRFAAPRVIYAPPLAPPVVMPRAPEDCGPGCGCGCQEGGPCNCAAPERQTLPVVVPVARMMPVCPPGG